MSTVNLTRLGGKHKKRGVSVFVALLSFSDILTSANAYELFKLPKNSFVVARRVQVITAFDSATSAVATLGVTGGATDFASTMNLKNTANTSAIAVPAVTTDGNAQTNLAILNLLVPKFYETGGTVIITPTYVGAPSVGQILVEIEYIEIDKTDGELTEFSSSP